MLVRSATRTSPWPAGDADHPASRPACRVWPTTEPVAPAAPEITRVSPGLGLPTLTRPRKAVLPVAPSTLKAHAVIDAPFPWGTLANAAPSRTGRSCQPIWPCTRSPTVKSGWRDSSTRPAPDPGMTEPMSHRVPVARDVFHPALLRRIEAEIERLEQHLALRGRGGRRGIEPKVLGQRSSDRPVGHQPLTMHRGGRGVLLNRTRSGRAGFTGVAPGGVGEDADAGRLLGRRRRTQRRAREHPGDDALDDRRHAGLHRPCGSRDSGRAAGPCALVERHASFQARHANAGRRSSSVPRASQSGGRYHSIVWYIRSPSG